MRTGSHIAGLVLLGSLLGVGCAREVAETPGCHKDKDCQSGSACVVGACIPTIGSNKQTWAVEILPKGESAFAPTENPMVTFSARPVSLQVESKVTVEGDIMGVDAELLPLAMMRALLSIPSSIGRPDRQFESQASRDADMPGEMHFKVTIPESAIGGSARVRIVPVAPVDKVLPVWSIALATLGPTIIVNVPRSNEVALVEGVLQNALGDAAEVGYLARALIGDRLVSNVDRTDDQGRFKLRIPTDPANAVDVEKVTVELGPADATMVRPRLVTKLTAAKLNLGILHLPALPKAQPFDVPVTAMGSGKKLAGVTLKFFAALPGAVGGEGSLTGEFQTDKDGIAHTLLFPGNAGATREYAVAIIPPPNSEYAARCYSSYAVAASPAGQTRVGASIELGPKIELSGVISDAAMMPRSGVILTASRRDSTYSTLCAADVVSPAASVTTAKDGAYRLLLEPGNYLFSYEPPMGSGSVLFQEVVTVSRKMQRNVSLPAGVLADGIVNAGDGSGVGCEVRVFDPAQDGQPPVLRAHTLADADGRFRILLPAKR